MVICRAVEENVGQDNIACVVDVNVSCNAAVILPALACTENDLGVALVSGFSPNIADMVMSGELDPYKCLVDKLMSGRYQQVEEALKE